MWIVHLRIHKVAFPMSARLAGVAKHEREREEEFLIQSGLGNMALLLQI